MCQVSSASTKPKVTATTLRIEPRRVAVVSSLVIRYMTIMTTSPWGMWWIMIGTVAAVHAKVRRSVAPSLPGVGASSRRRNSTRGEVARAGGRSRRLPMGSAARPRPTDRLVDGHDSRGADAEGLVGILHLDAYREPCGEAHPVDRLLDSRKPHHAGSVFREHRPSEADHGAPKTLGR